MGQDNEVPRRINRVAGVAGQWMRSQGAEAVEEWSSIVNLLELITGDGIWAGLVEEGEAGEDISQWELVVLGPDGKWYLADATHCYKTGSDDRANGEGADHLIDDTNAQFEAADVGAIVWNTTDDTYAVVTVYNDQGDVTLSASIFTNGENYIIFRMVRGRLAIATEAITSGNTGTLFTKGFVRHDAWAFATIHAWVYASATAGALTLTRPTGSNQGRRVGVVHSAGILWFNPDMIDYMEGARVTHSVDQTIPNAVTTAVVFDTETYDTDNIHHNVTNNSRLTCRTPGKYAIVGLVRFEVGNGAGQRLIALRVNGAIWLGQICWETATSLTQMGISQIYDLVAGDYVELMVSHTDGVAGLDAKAETGAPNFEMQRIG